MQPHNLKHHLIRGALLATLAGVSAGWAAEPTNGAGPGGSPFRVDSTLVLVPVTVVDRRGAIVNGLSGNAFTLTEDGARQPIKSFSEDDAPVSLGIVLDLSGSMKGYLPTAKEAFRSLMGDANPEDQVFLNGVSTQPRAYSSFGDSFEETMQRVESEPAGGFTALIDTVYLSSQELRGSVHSRKALVVISDGMDNHSRYTSTELARQLEEADAQIYTIAVVSAVSPIQPPKPLIMTEGQRGQHFLEELAARTGGMSFVAGDKAAVFKAAAAIGRALRNQYTIGYARCGNGDGKWRKISVKVAGSGLRVYARAGYRAD